MRFSSLLKRLEKDAEKGLKGFAEKKQALVPYCTISNPVIFSTKGL